MSSEIFDKNIGDLVKRGALRPDAARARERFLGAVGAQPERRSWKVAAAAAAVLACVTIVWSAKKPEPVVAPITRTTEKPLPPAPVVAAQQGDELLRGELKLPSGQDRRPIYHFIGKSPLPDGLYFPIRVHRLHEAVSGTALQPVSEEESSWTPKLENGAFDFDWPGNAPGLLHIDVSAPDDLQERELVRRLKVKESERRWAFEYPAWDDRLRSLLEPQLAEVDALALEARKIVERCEAAVATEELFRSQQKQLAADAERLVVRANNFAQKSLYPAALHEIEYTVRNLGVLMQYFKWIDGKFAGPKSYYGDGKGDQTHRNEAFAFDALRSYLNDALRIGGREFGLWIMKDVRRAGMDPALVTLVKNQAGNPAVALFVDRLLNLTTETASALEATLRKL